MHDHAAWVEPAIDREAVALSDVHHVVVRRFLAGRLCNSSIRVDGGLLRPDLLPVLFAVFLRTPLRLLVGVAIAPALLRFLFDCEESNPSKICFMSTASPVPFASSTASAASTARIILVV